MNNKKINSVIVIGKILVSFGIVLVTGLIWFFIKLIINFDGNWNSIINALCLFLFPVILLLLIWGNQNRKFKGILAIVTFLIMSVNIFYYDNCSMKIEPLIHLHNEYKISFSDMNIIKTTRRFVGVLNGDPRSAIVRYKEYDIYVYYDVDEEKWIDNYKGKMKYNDRYDIISEKFSSIIKQHTNNFKILKDLQWRWSDDVDTDSGDAHYGYIIYLYSEDETAVDYIIDKLNVSVVSNNDCNVTYSLYIVKDKVFYDKLVGTDISELNSDNTGSITQTSATEIFEIMGYDSERIAFNYGYSNDIFINNGNPNDDEYQKIEKFEYVVFVYSAEWNDFNVGNSPIFKVFGVSK